MVVRGRERVIREIGRDRREAREGRELQEGVLQSCKLPALAVYGWHGHMRCMAIQQAPATLSSLLILSYLHVGKACNHMCSEVRRDGCRLGFIWSSGG
jgi:hypothetical protein